MSKIVVYIAGSLTAEQVAAFYNDLLGRVSASPALNIEIIVQDGRVVPPGNTQ